MEMSFSHRRITDKFQSLESDVKKQQLAKNYLKYLDVGIFTLHSSF